jgi:exosortase
MTGEDSAPQRLQFNPGLAAALASALIACVVLLGFIPYCTSYGAGKVSLFYLWTTTFWGDLAAQGVDLVRWLANSISGVWPWLSGELYHLIGQTPGETQSGEASAGEWNYCLMVPFIVAWLVWRQWPKLRELPLTGGAFGYAFLGFGFFTYVAGFLMESYYAGFVAMEFVYAGLIVLFLGWAALRLLVFPIAFTMFMWPYNFMEDVALELRLHMSALSHYVLQFIAVPNMLQGTAVMSLPGSPTPFAIDIADPCSGIRSLFALVMIAALYAFIGFEKVWHQVVLITLAIPLVFLGNLVRIVILALGTIHFGETFALGSNEHPSWFHECAGYLVYFVNFGGLMAVGSFLSKLTAPSGPQNETPPGNDEDAGTAHAQS